MPYSKELGGIFVAIPKTGSTSLASAFKKMHAQYGDELSLMKAKVTDEYREKYNLNELKDNHPGREKHLSAIQIKYILGEEEFDRCFKFSIVRNPYARLVTRYFYTHENNEPDNEEKERRGTTRTFHNLSFEKWIERRWKKFQKKKQQTSQLHKLVDLEGNLLVDYVGRLESIQESLDYICDKLGQKRMEMPHVNTTGKRPHYSTYYSDEARDMVREICKDDLEAFNFEFEDRRESSN